MTGARAYRMLAKQNPTDETASDWGAPAASLLSKQKGTSDTPMYPFFLSLPICLLTRVGFDFGRSVFAIAGILIQHGSGHRPDLYGP